MNTHISVVPHQGRTMIAVNGQVIPGNAYFTYMLHSGEFRRDILREIVESGTRLFFCLWQAWQPRNRPEPWREDGALDFSGLDEYMAALATFSDELWFIPRIFLSAPAWWAARYPEELVRLSDGVLTRDQVDGEHVLRQPSMASRWWRDSAGQVLRRLVEHVENGPFADRVLGYMVNSGGTEEWVYWGAQEGRMPDDSAPAAAAFRVWLRQQYRSDDALADAWHHPGLTCEQAGIPSEAARRRGAPLHLRDPRVDQAAIDYARFLSEMNADCLLELCHTVKEATHGQRLTGAFYGYLLWQSGYANAIVNNGHLAVRRLLESPDIDFLTGITSYDNREPDGPGSFMLPVESVQAAGKLVLNEVDLRTHLTPGSRLPKVDRDPGDMANLWPLQDAAESVSVYRREFAHHLIHGAAWWNFDMGGGWYSCPEMLADFHRQSEIAREALAWDCASVADVAAVISAGSPAYQRYYTMQEAMTHCAWTDLQCDRATAPLYRSGAILDWWMTDDLRHEALRRYKVLYLFNAFYLSRQERAALEALKSDGRTLIFIGLPGMVDEHAVNLGLAEEVVGMHLRLHEGRRPLRIDITDYDHPIFQECEAEVSLGTGALVGPCLSVDDADSRTLGVWRTGGESALAIKELGNWTSIFCPAPINHALTFRGMARRAGCHLWVEPGRICFANRSLLAVHFTPFSQPIRVHLPQPMDVTELFSQTPVAKHATDFLIQSTRRHATLLYHLTPGATDAGGAM